MKKLGAFSKFIVVLVVLLNVAFAVCVLWLFYMTGREPTTLIAAWFGFTTGELWMLSRIKRDELRGDNNNLSQLLDMDMDMDMDMKGGTRNRDEERKV